MQTVELIIRNSLGCEIARHPCVVDDDGPLMLATLAQDEVRDSVSVLTVGDTISIEERWTENS